MGATEHYEGGGAGWGFAWSEGGPFLAPIMGGGVGTKILQAFELFSPSAQIGSRA